MDPLRTESIETQMLVIAESKDLTKAEARELVDDFRSMASIDFDVEEKALAIAVTDESQVDLMAQARELRLELKAQRIAVDKHREAKKSYHLSVGQVIDGVAKVLRDLITPLEKHLGDQENFAKIQEEKRETERREKADALLKKQEEADRLEKEADDKRVREENARLKEREASRDRDENAARAAEQKIADEKASKARADAERSRRAAVQLEREKSEKILAEHAEAHRQAQEKEKALYQEELRRARLVTCPECGHEFTQLTDAEHKAVAHE